MDCETIARFNLCHFTFGFRCEQSNLEYDHWAQQCWENCDCKERPNPPCGLRLDGTADLSVCPDKAPAPATESPKSLLTPTSLPPVAEAKDLVTRNEDVGEVPETADAYVLQCRMMQGDCARDYGFHCVRWEVYYRYWNAICWDNCYCSYTPFGGVGSGSGIMLEEPNSDTNATTMTTSTISLAGPTTALVTRSEVIVAEDPSPKKDELALDHSGLTSRVPAEGLSDTPDVEQIPDAWFLDCSGITNTCGGRPYRYFCSSTGRLSWSQSNTTCDMDCQCRFQSTGDGGCRTSSADGSTSCIGVEESASVDNNTDAASDDSADVTGEE